MPDPPVINGLPYTQPAAFTVDGVENAFAYRRSTIQQSASIGKLVNIKTQGSSVLADKDESLEANAVIVRVPSANVIYHTTDSDIWMTVSGASTTQNQKVYLSTSGGVTVTQPTSGLVQPVGFIAAYNGSTVKHLVSFRVSPGGVQTSDTIENDSGGAVTLGYIYGRSSGLLALAQSGAPAVRPAYLAMADAEDGSNFRIAKVGRLRVKPQAVKTYTIGAFAWVSASTPGTVTDTRPAATYFLVGTFDEEDIGADGLIAVNMNIGNTGGS